VPIGERIGDTLAVTGAGANTRLLVSTRNGTAVVVFTTADGSYYTPNIVDVTTATAGFAGLGLAAGAGDTFWATSSGDFPLTRVFYDLINGTNAIQLSLAGPSGYNIAVDSVNGFIADTGTADTPSNLRLIDVASDSTTAILLDQEFFGTDNDNANGTGAVALDIADGRIFALDTNNGLLALKYAPKLYHRMFGGNPVLTWSGPGALQSASDIAGSYTDISGATSPYTNTTSGPLFFRVRR
jgi:hypothetical protein